MNRKLFTALTLAVGTCFAWLSSIPVLGAEKPNTGETLDQRKDKPSIDYGAVTPVIQFGPSVMTDSRAQSIAEEAGSPSYGGLPAVAMSPTA